MTDPTRLSVRESVCCSRDVLNWPEKTTLLGESASRASFPVKRS